MKYFLYVITLQNIKLTLTLETNQSDTEQNNENIKTKVDLFFLASELAITPSSLYNNRPTLQLTKDKSKHINEELIRAEFQQDEQTKTKSKSSFKTLQTQREVDYLRLSHHLSNSTEINLKISEKLILNMLKSIEKSDLIDKLIDYFNKSSENKLLYISGICNENREFIYPHHNPSYNFSLSYDEIVSLWRNRKQSDKEKHLFIVVDCHYSGLWVNKCNDEFDYRDISIQASSTNNEESYDLELINNNINNNDRVIDMNEANKGSLFLNNFIHSQILLNHTFINELTKSFDEIKKETDVSPIITNIYFEKEEAENNELNKQNKHDSFDKSQLSNSRLISNYNQSPSSCGMYFNIAKNFKINAMFNSWDDIVKINGYYKEKNITEINAIYKGEYIDGKPNGKGALYFMGIEEKYLGDFNLGVKQGKGIYYYNDTNVYEGLWRKDSRHKGVIIGVNGDWYAGEFSKEVFNGKGKLYNREKQFLYDGEFKDGSQDGYGISYFDYGSTYKGFFKDNEYNGKGEFYFNNTLISKANYVNGKREGKGWFLLKEGHNYTGNFVNNMAKGKGKMKFINGDIYEGDFDNGRPNGVGEFTYENGNSYKGDVVNGKRHGKGKLYVLNGDVYEGDFKDDAITGNGALYYDKGIYKGEFINGKFNGKGSLMLRSGGRFEGEFRDGRIYRHEDDL